MSAHIASLRPAGTWNGLADEFITREHATADFVSLIAHAAWARPSMSYRTTSGRVDQLINDEAWVDAALALVDGDLPSWKLRRLAYDGGAWHCALSRRRELPEWLDDAVDVSHADLALAVLRAFVEVMRQDIGEDEALHPAADPAELRVRWPQNNLMCCDNFA